MSSDLGASIASDSQSPSFPLLLQRSLVRKYQALLDESVPYLLIRWGLLLVLILVYFLRVFYVQGFYIVTYGIGIYVLNLFIGFLTPLDDKDTGDGDGPLLPVSDADEFKPFIRRLPEFKFWHSCSKALVVGLVMTFFRVFDVPVFWPILLIYFLVLFFLTMKRQILHMLKHKYLPFTLGKKRYASRPRPQEDIRTK